ncbi:MAG: PP2C family serine/threonine-protein phosphatase [Eubacteriales bacterium]
MTAEHNIQLTSLSVSGRKHRDKGNPCEDASLSVNQEGVYVVCLSDGAGGSQYIHADIGSKCVVQTICDLMVHHFDAFFFELHESVIRSVLVAAVQSELAIKSQELMLGGMDTLSATMLFCAVKDTRMICGHIGDGIIARVTGSGMQPVFLPQNGEDASSTIFMTLPDAQDYLRVVRTTIDDTHAVVLMTDGISDMVFDSTKLLLMPVVARLAELASLSKEESEMQMNQTIKSFIVDSSPLSDDASIGILYMPGTMAPDLDSLPFDKENCIRNNGDVMRDVQKEILPRVRAAQEIVSQNHINTEAIKATGMEGKVSEERTREKAEEGEKEDGTTAVEVPVSQHSFLGWRRILFACGLFLLAIFIGLTLYYYVF